MDLRPPQEDTHRTRHMLALAPVDTQETPSKRAQAPHRWDATDRLKRTDIADRKIPGNWEGNLIIEACRYFCLSYVRPWPVKLLRISLAYRSRPAMERDMNLPACIGSYIGLLLRHDGGLPAPRRLGECTVSVADSLNTWWNDATHVSGTKATASTIALTGQLSAS